MPIQRRNSGFTLVELLVAVALGTIFLAMTMRGFIQFEQRNRNAIANADALQNGVSAMFAIEADAAQAGWGLNDNFLFGCDTRVAFTTGFALAQSPRGSGNITPMAPVIIASGGVGPDTITFYSGASVFGAGSLKLIDDLGAGQNTMTVDRAPFGFSRNDVVLIAPEGGGGNCVLAQVTTDPSALPAPPANQTIGLQSATGVAFDGNSSRVYTLGPVAELAFHTWSIAGGALRLRAADMAGAATTPAVVATNVVSIKALYGFDTNATFNPLVGTAITRWSNTMIDADGDGVVGSAGDYQRIVAVRVGLVARNSDIEKPPAVGNCTSTSAAPVLFAAREPQSADTVAITPNLAVTGDPVDWRCYTYQAYETVVPLRNAGWRAIAS